MEKIKEFLANISKTGWIVVSLVLVVIILIFVSFYSKNIGFDFITLGGKEDKNEEKNEQLVIDKIEEAIESSQKSVLTVEDVYAGKYNNSYESATVYIQNTKKVSAAVVIDTSTYKIDNPIETKCGDFTYVVLRVPDRPTILTETIKSIFDNKVIADFTPGNIIPQYHPNLLFDNVIIQNGTAEIYLKGDFGSDNKDMCKKQLAIDTLKLSAKQFPGIKEVEIYLNLQKIN